MRRPILLTLLASAGLAGCVTNIEGKAAEQCAPLASNGTAYADCVETAEARMREENRRTARIIAAGLGGGAGASQGGLAPAAQGYRSPPSQQGLFLERSYVSGLNRICIYKGVRGEEAMTIGAAEMCPLSR